MKARKEKIKVRTSQLLLVTGIVSLFLAVPAFASGGYTSAFTIGTIEDASSSAEGLLIAPASPATVDNSGDACTYSDYYAFSPTYGSSSTDQSYKEKATLIMAAYLNGRQIQVYLNQTSGDCVFSRPRVVEIEIE